MKPFGSKKSKMSVGDGCFHCTRERKETKSAIRTRVRIALQKEIQRDHERALQNYIERVKFERKLSF